MEEFSQYREDIIAESRRKPGSIKKASRAELEKLTHGNLLMAFNKLFDSLMDKSEELNELLIFQDELKKVGKILEKKKIENRLSSLNFSKNKLMIN